VSPAQPATGCLLKLYWPMLGFGIVQPAGSISGRAALRERESKCCNDLARAFAKDKSPAANTGAHKENIKSKEVSPTRRLYCIRTVHIFLESPPVYRNTCIVALHWRMLVRTQLASRPTWWHCPRRHHLTRIARLPRSYEEKLRFQSCEVRHGQEGRGISTDKLQR
jgi:hypothetical protein